MLVFRWDTTCIFLLLSCTTDGSLEFDTRYQHFCFVLLVSRFYRKVRCLFFFLFSEEFWCFIYRDLNLVSLMPYYILFLSFSVMDVIFALYKTLLLRNILFKGHFDFLIQLHPLAWADGCRFVTVILCMLICEPNGWTGFWVMGFNERSFRAERNLSFAWEWKICFSRAVLCFSVRGSDSRVPAPSPA